jgi:hypothetical protein
VIDQTGQHFNRLRDQAGLDVNDMATRARAFGGSRHGVALGKTLGSLYSQEGQTVAGLQHAGFQDAMQRAQFALGQGMSALGQIPAFSNMNDPNMRAMSIWQQGMQGLPLGTTSSAPNPNKQNPWVAGLGGAITGATLGGAKLPGFGGGGASAGSGSIWNWGGGING